MARNKREVTPEVIRQKIEKYSRKIDKLYEQLQTKQSEYMGFSYSNKNKPVK